MKKNILFLAPHLSTGGMPQFLLKRIELLDGLKNFNHRYNIFVVEYECVSDIYTVQRDKIKQLVKDNFFTLGADKLQLIDIINKNSIDLVHIENEAEGFDFNLMKALYSDDRSYRIVETCHNVSFDPKRKVFIPDGFAYCSPYHEITFKELNVYSELLEYPIMPKSFEQSQRSEIIEKLRFNPNKINVLNVGLWTKGKNQGEGIEIARKFPDVDFHFVGNQAENFKDYWQPLIQNLPENVKVWGEQKNIDEFMIASDMFMFNSINECNPLVLKEAIGHGLPIYAHNLPQYCGIYNDYISDNFSKVMKATENNEMCCTTPTQNAEFLSKSIAFYNSILAQEITIQPKSTFNFISHFVDGAYFEIVGNSNSKFRVEFTDENGTVVYENTIGCNEWVKLNRKYFTKYTIKVYKLESCIVDWEKDGLFEVCVYSKTLSLENKKVMICFDSSSLGDTLAWMPYCDEFQKKHRCELVVSTFKNFLFEGMYPNIKFIEPATVENNLYAKYNLGWYYDSDKEPLLPNTIPLQQTATNILGLDFKEKRPKLNFKSNGFKIEGNIYPKHVCIATNSTSGCKEWSAENWQKVIFYLQESGYSVVNVSKENNYDLKGLINIKDFSIENTMQIINSSDFFIGLSSGLSWLSWALWTHTIMISNFTEQGHEFTMDTTRITNPNVCHGCWNNKNFKFDKGNWNWCPIYEGYDKQFECQKSILPESVIEAIKELILQNKF
jgi:autotransporter strand-loop-strand O-heptosyltransferase